MASLTLAHSASLTLSRVFSLPDENEPLDHVALLEKPRGSLRHRRPLAQRELQLDCLARDVPLYGPADHSRLRWLVTREDVDEVIDG